MSHVDSVDCGLADDVRTYRGLSTHRHFEGNEQLLEHLNLCSKLSIHGGQRAVVKGINFPRATGLKKKVVFSCFPAPQHDGSDSAHVEDRCSLEEGGLLETAILPR